MVTNILHLSSVRIEQDPKQIGKALDEIRNSFGYTHREMCAMLQISEETYYRWRRTGNYVGVFLFQMTSCADPAVHLTQGE